jgi:hypothetical protein
MTSKPSGTPPGHENPHAGQGSVLLDIGGDVGALVVTMPREMVGTEIEIEPHGGLDHDHRDEPFHRHGDGHVHGHVHGHDHRPHVAVVDRPVAAGTQPSLVFPELREGPYALFDKGGDRVLLTVEITGGQVSFAEWPQG